MQIYRVGGFIRDRLLGLKASDCDYVVIGSSPQEMLSKGFTQVGKSFPVFLHPITHEEYALARTEKKIADGHCGFLINSSPNVTLEEDLSRRDLTINAIAEDIHTYKVIDPFNGIQDLKDKLLRYISPAFTEDPLRVFRVARFAAKLNFTVTPDTLDLMQKITLSDELKTISIERISDEFHKAFSTEYSFNFLKVLFDCNALSQIFPELHILYTQQHQSLLNILNKNTSFTKGYLGIKLLLILNHQEPSITNLKFSNELAKLSSLFLATIDYLLSEYNVEQLFNLVQKLDLNRNLNRYNELILDVEYFNQMIFQNKYFIKIEQLKHICQRIYNLPIKTIINNISPNEIKSVLHRIKLDIIKQEII